LVEVEYPLIYIVFNLLKDSIWFNKLKTISEGVLLLQNTVTREQFEDYQRVFNFYQILSPLNKLKTVSEGVLLLLNTDIVFSSFNGNSIW
jgi:hypothetical protein